MSDGTTSVATSADAVRAAQRLLIGNGALILLWGFAVGFGFVFFLLGEIRLWPIPGVIDYQMPGTYDAWRMAHMEGIVNGFALWGAALILPLLPVSSRLLRGLCWAFILTGWTFVIASLMDPLFPESRGLAFGGSVPNLVAFFLFYVGVLAVIWAAAVIAWSCLGRFRK